MELKLKLVKDDMLGSTIGELSSFSEMGEHHCLSVLMSALVNDSFLGTTAPALDTRRALWSPPARVDN